VSCYIADANTPQAKTYLLESGATFAFTPLHALEVRNAFKLGVFRELLTNAEATAAWRNVERDLRSGRLVRQPVKWASVLRLAARLSNQHSSVYGTRSLDIIHVATAKLSRVQEFVSFDSRQRDLALAIGLRIFP
jgi:predicted nucleic acid-binding protein